MPTLTAESGSRQCACGRTISANKTACRECSAKPTGSLEILNVQGGDMKITFDKANVSETIRAKRIITDMLRRGYALIVEVERDGEKKYERVQEFDAERGEYIIADFEPIQDQAKPRARVEREEHPYEPRAQPVEDEPEISASAEPLKDKKGNGRKRQRLPMEGTRATAVGRSAGG